MIWTRPVSLVNGRVMTPDGEVESLRFGRRILGLGCPPARGDVVVDLAGGWVLPGLINAHDHLELNHYGPQPGRGSYTNVRQWVDDMRPRLTTDRTLVEERRRPLAARVFAGGLKNLLAGVTLVAHHNPMYPGVHRASPVPVLRRFGWAHSLAMQDAPVGANGERGGAVARRFRDTPADRPFILHAAEGLDGEAADEIDRLDRAGVLAPHAVIVHGLAAEASQVALLAARQVGLVWCPASNLALFGRTWAWERLRTLGSGRLALATDSRLTGSRDLLDELQVAAAQGRVSADDLLPLVTTGPAALLQCPAAGRLIERGTADFIVIPRHGASAGAALLATRRADLQLVVTGGRPRVGAESLRSVFSARGVSTGVLVVDGCRRVVDHALMRAYGRYAIAEPGVRLGTAIA